MGKDIFRKVSLEKLTSPEQLNRLLVIVRLKGWIVLTVIGILIVGAICWSIFGSIPVTVSGRGMIFHEGAIQSVRARVEGHIGKLYVHAGDQVKKGDLLADVDNPLLKNELETQRKIVKAMKEEIDRGQHLKKSQVDFQQTFLKLKKAKLEGLQRERVKSQEALYLSQIERAIFDQKLLINDQEEKMAFMQSDDDFTGSLKLDYIRSVGELQTLERQVGNLEVRSPALGKVVEVNVAKEADIDSGEILFWIQPSLKKGEVMDIHAFFPIEEAGRIEKGMKAEVQFARIDSAKYGQLIGHVIDVFPYAVSQSAEELQSIPSKSLRQYLIGGEARVLVKIRPVADSSSKSGYKWTKKGPPFEIEPGSLGRVHIFVEEMSPIAYLLPSFRR